MFKKHVFSILAAIREPLFPQTVTSSDSSYTIIIPAGEKSGRDSKIADSGDQLRSSAIPHFRYAMIANNAIFV
jgi:hypothetical protein